LRWGTRDSFRVEKRRAQYRKETGLSAGAGVSVETLESSMWWKQELKMLASIPVIFLFALFLFALLTGIFVLEAFVAQLYTGPAQKIVVSHPIVHQIYYR